VNFLCITKNIVENKKVILLRQSDQRLEQSAATCCRWYGS